LADLTFVVCKLESTCRVEQTRVKRAPARVSEYPRVMARGLSTLRRC
jgi:hypothetical protein